MSFDSTYTWKEIVTFDSNISKAKTGEAYLEKRMRVMELFLQNCLYHPLFKTHPAFSDFLEIAEDAKLKEKFQ